MPFGMGWWAPLCRVSIHSWPGQSSPSPPAFEAAVHKALTLVRAASREFTQCKCKVQAALAAHARLAE